VTSVVEGALMADYGRTLEFGVSVTPLTESIALSRAIATRADTLGLDLVGIQDHPYQRRFVERWPLIADLLARTERVRVFPDVANLPLRLPAMIAKQAASLDVLSGGRSSWASAAAPSGTRSPRWEVRGGAAERRSRRWKRRS
jgi:alkanesulfonate monooxygenase SsuD/methylene tetrahydromethanopterin reductase-like flavin-dependent oxidoreductase (luciferase family)